MGEEAPRPRSPPTYPGLCGRRRLQLEVQILNREVGFLEVSRPWRRTTNLLLFSSSEENRDHPCSCCLSLTLHLAETLSGYLQVSARAKQRLSLAHEAMCLRLTGTARLSFFWQQEMQERIQPVSRCCKE
jgi:hypothetical protein